MTALEHDSADIERSSLPAHVALCKERYKALDGTLNRVDRRVWRIEVWAVTGLCAVIAELLAVIYLLWRAS